MLHALVVDDSALIRMQVADVMRRADFQVTEAENGEVAYRAFLDDEFDIVIADIIMPVCDGVELIDRIRLQDTKIPILVLSSARGRDYICQAKAAGANGYLLKPMDEEVFLERLGQLLPTACAESSA